MVGTTRRNGFRQMGWAALALCVLLLSPASALDIIKTIAGGGSLEGYKPLDSNLLLGNSQGLALDALGRLYISDSGQHQVLKLDPSTGIVTVVAGDGTAAYFGDGTPGPSAGLNSPGGLAMDPKGNLLIVDRGNFVIRRVDAITGIVSTVAGIGLFTGQVVGNNPPAPLGDGGAATSATFANMGGIVLDSAGNVIVADSGNNCVRRFTIGGTIATIAGTPQTSGFSGDGVAGGATAALFKQPTGLAVDRTGNIFIADSSSRRIRKLDGTNTINTIAGNGTGGGGGFSGDGGDATMAQIGSLGGLAFDPTGKLLVSCVGAGCIRKIDLSATPNIILTVAGNGAAIVGDLGPATGATLSGPSDVASDSGGNIFIYDANDGRVRRVDAATQFIDTVIGTGLQGFVGDRGPFQDGILVFPQGAAYDGAGNLYVADTGDNAVRMIAPSGIISTIAGNGTGGGLGDGGPAVLGTLNTPTDVAIFGNTLFVCDNGNGRIRAIDLPTRTISTYVQLNNPVAIIVDAAGVLYVARNNQVDKVAVDKTVTTFVGSAPLNTAANPLGDGLPAANATLGGPNGLALGPAGELYIADTGNGLIRKIDPAGVTSTVAGGGNPAFPSVGDGGAALAASLNNPLGVAISSNGNLVISDSGNNRIRVLNLASGTINSIAGNGTAGFSGDGDAAASALVNFPGKIFAYGTGVVFADINNNRIRQIVTAIDIDPKQFSLAFKLDFAADKKTGELPFAKDVVALKAGLALPAGINPANLIVQVSIVDLHQEIQLDGSGKQSSKSAKVTKNHKATTGGSFVFTAEQPPAPPITKVALGLKGVSVAGGKSGKPTSFTFTSAGTFRDELGRAGFTDLSTSKTGVKLPVRIDITLGTTTFTGVTNVLYKAQQGKGGAGKSTK